VEEINKNSSTKRDFLIRERNKRRLTQLQVADYLGIHHSTYSNIERGDRDPSLEVAIAISDFFGIDIRLLRK